jgi:hypothetical protein
MKRFAYAGTVLLAIVIGIPATQAETNQSAAVKTTTSAEISAFDLAFLAYRGYFRDQGIPGYGTLSSAHRSGRIRAKDVVQAAVKTNRVSEQKLSNRTYLNDIDTNLRALDPRR